MIETIVRTAVIGVGATLLLDVFLLVRRRLFGVRSPDWRLVGRWIGHMRKGRFTHAAIGQSEPVAREGAIGWAAHYAIGVAFAAILVLAAGPEWLGEPMPWPALAVGVGSVAAPFFLMQPAFGLGVAASRAPGPWRARAQSVVNHAVFGAGLYAAAAALSFVFA